MDAKQKLWLALVAWLLVAPAQPAQEPTQIIRIAPDEVTFSSNSAWPAGPQTAVMAGDPNQPGPYSVRVRIPANLTIMPHSHPDQIRMVTVLSGTLYYAFGDEFDEAKLRPLGPGTFMTEPKGLAHFAQTRDEEVIVQLFAIGPTGTTYVNPADDPRKK